MSFQGTPCWYELGTSDLDGARDFYSRVLDWRITDSGMEGFDYRLAEGSNGAVAGMMSTSFQAGNPPPNWLIYFAVDDCDRSAASVRGAGGKICKDPADIPDVGRFAIVSDPQGAVFGLLQPDMSRMSPEDRAKVAAGEGAFDQRKAGHAHWNELMSSDPPAGLAFYSSLFGWTKGDAMDMGDMGTYQFIRHRDDDIGAIMGLGDAPMPVWLPYFGAVRPVTETVEAIKSAGGRIHHGPAEVPGPLYIAVAQDPQGAWFGVVGAEQ